MEVNVNEVEQKFLEFFNGNREKWMASDTARKQAELREAYNAEFPLEKFANLSLEEYVTGTGTKDTYCYRAEFGDYKEYGPAIGGSSATKFGIYYSKSQQTYRTWDGAVTNPTEFWEKLRAEFVRMMETVRVANDAAEIAPDPLKGMGMFMIKLAYFSAPEKVVSIAGRRHLLDILDWFGYEYNEQFSSLQLSFHLNKLLRERIPELRDVEPWLLGTILWEFMEELKSKESSNEPGEQVILTDSEHEAYTKEDFLKEVLITDTQYDMIVDTLKRKKNIILQGVPGVGKTFCAKKLMYSLMGEKVEERIKTVQFHQSYAYEDFVQGYRPDENGQFVRKNGVFYELVKEAIRECELAKAENRENPRKYCIIIDEINRGNLSKIFGELMMLIESDKRSEKWGATLTYSDEIFYVPKNLYIIGTMNTADRSLTMVDYALRRRFAFIDLSPAYKLDEFKKYMTKVEKLDAGLVGRLAETYCKLNDYITAELGKDFQIGHSYFIGQNLDADNFEEKYKNIVSYEIAPLLNEYFYDNSEKMEEALKIIEKI